MLIGGMIWHKVQDEFEVALVGLVQQAIQVLQGPEERMNSRVITNIIAKIGHRRRIDGREPDRVNAEPAKVIQLADDPREIAYSISIAVEKTAGVELFI